MQKSLVWLVLILSASVQMAFADGPADNLADKVRQIPPPGVEISAEDRESLAQGVAELGERIQRLKLRRDALTPRLLPDVEIFHRAVDQALTYNEFFNVNDVKKARELLAEGIKRAEGVQSGDHYWTRQTGLVVRGYRSKLDDTVQPYGLVIPSSWQPGDWRYRHRLDLWFHGRGETSCEVQFIHGRMTQVGQIAPMHTFVLHPYGRYSNAFKFAGEVDVWEALEHAQQNYPIDEDRIAVRGFSMGGAGAWHFAVHYPDKFFAANPGAGFSETPEFLKSFQGETLNPPWYEETLWQLYDCPPWVTNLQMIPTIAYSGEIDKQKQAADVMAVACEKAGMNLTHIIGPQTAHAIHKDSLAEIEKKLAQIEKIPRRTWTPAKEWLNVTTCTLKYNQYGVIRINGLHEHWTNSSVSILPGEFLISNSPAIDPRNIHEVSEGRLKAFVNGVNDFSLALTAGSLWHDPLPDVHAFVEIIDLGHNTSLPNGQTVKSGGWVMLPKPATDGSWEFRLYRDGDQWKSGTPTWENELRKRHGLQGPIDDAFMDSFLFVVPSGVCQHEMVENWVKSELEHGKAHWRQQMRGDVRIKADKDVTDEDIANHNLILWGDAQSNSLISKVLPDLPIKWTAETLQVGEQPAVDAKSHAPVLIYPNPLNRQKYVVLNSSFTYREYDYLNNARQTPKLPDWAVIDLTTPPNSRWPGKVVQADFFDERWGVKNKK